MVAGIITPPLSPAAEPCSKPTMLELESTTDLGPLSVTCCIPNELLCHTFDSMSSKELVCLRGVSPHFANVINYTLRCRFLSIVQGGQYEVLFESCTPSETRYTHNKLLKLSHFEPATSNVGGGDAAFFSVPGNTSCYMPLDDMEEFCTNLLALQIRSVVPALPSPPDTPEPSPSSSPTRSVPASFSQQSRQGHPFTIPLHRFQFAVNIGSGHSRLFRHQFEGPRLATFTEDTSSNPRPVVPHVLVPSGSSALLSAQIICYRVPSLARSNAATLSTTRNQHSPASGPSSNPSFRPIPLQSATTRLYEYYFERVKVDVSRFVVKFEEGRADTNSLQFFVPTVRRRA